MPSIEAVLEAIEKEPVRESRSVSPQHSLDLRMLRLVERARSFVPQGVPAQGNESGAAQQSGTIVQQPVVHVHIELPVSRRDIIAALALAGLMTDNDHTTSKGQAVFATSAADALIAQLDTPEEQE